MTEPQKVLLKQARIKLIEAQHQMMQLSEEYKVINELIAEIEKLLGII